MNAACEPVGVLVVQGPSGQATEIEAIIDTGFTGFLTVTPALAVGCPGASAPGSPGCYSVGGAIGSKKEAPHWIRCLS